MTSEAPLTVREAVRRDGWVIIGILAGIALCAAVVAYTPWYDWFFSPMAQDPCAATPPEGELVDSCPTTIPVFGILILVLLVTMTMAATRRVWRFA